jgi:hypothetical protein
MPQEGVKPTALVRFAAFLECPMPERSRPSPLDRRALLAGIALSALGMWQSRGSIAVRAQDATPSAIGTPSAGIGVIKPTGVGDVPSTGASRPGPADIVQGLIEPEIVSPVGLTIETAGVDAAIENLRVVDGAMQDPSGPWVVAWYENLGSLGSLGNVVMAGHIDYWNVGPSVFYNLAAVQPGEEIIVSGDDGKTYPFTVEWVQQFNSDAMPLDEVTGSGEGQSLTLITCGGAFDYANGQYLQRTVVRASRSGPGQAATA